MNIIYVITSRLLLIFPEISGKFTRPTLVNVTEAENRHYIQLYLLTTITCAYKLSMWVCCLDDDDDEIAYFTVL